MKKYIINTPYQQKLFASFDELKSFFEGVSDKALNEAIDTGCPIHKMKDDWYIDELA